MFVLRKLFWNKQFTRLHTNYSQKLNIVKANNGISRGARETLLKASSNEHPAGQTTINKSANIINFKDLGIRQDLHKALDAQGIITPTRIQVNTIQHILAGNNVLCAAQTGSGKTLAYLLAIIQQLKNIEETQGVIARQLRPRACIVVPFRELALQVLSVIKFLSHFAKVRSLGLISGRKKKWIREGLTYPVDIVVCTPYTLLKYQEKGEIYLSDLSHIVIDEADTMFDASFISLTVDILKLAGIASSDWHREMSVTQATMVTATLSQDVLKIIHSIIPDLQMAVENLHKLLPNISQKFIKIAQHDKSELLKDLVLKELKQIKDKQLMIFCNTTKSCDWTSYFLEEQGVSHARLNGNMTKKGRKLHMTMFQDKKVSTIVCTDVASRGMDTTEVHHVINFDFPANVVDYIHRAGRTGRLGHDSISKPKVTSLLSHNRDVTTMEQIRKAMVQDMPLEDTNLWRIHSNKR